MEDHKITTNIVTFCQLKNQDFQIDADNYNIASTVLDNNKIKTALNCPNNTNNNNPAFFFESVDDIIAGRVQLFGTKMKLGETIVNCGSASALEVAEPYRKLGIGADIMFFFTFNVPYQTIIVSGLSEKALPLYRILKYNILEFPRIMFLNNSRCIIESKGVSGHMLKLFTKIANQPFKLFKYIINKKAKSNLKLVEIRNEKEIPFWVNEISLKGGEKYMEIHDRQWMDWNLNNNLNGEERDQQWFYGIYKNKKPIGYFMTKERFRKSAADILHNVLIGSIMEWGTLDETLLSELDIYILAFTTFNKDIDIIETATSSLKVVKAMKKMGFLHHGNAHIAFKDNTKKHNDASDINLWRIRYGYADVFLT